jgi:hypothetical protein
MLCKNPPDYVLVYICAECEVDLVGNARAAPSRIALFHLNDGSNHLAIWSFWSGLTSPLRENRN